MESCVAWSCLWEESAEMDPAKTVARGRMIVKKRSLMSASNAHLCAFIFLMKVCEVSLIVNGSNYVI